LSLFISSLVPLGERLGPVLIQLPPTASYVPGWLEKVLGLLPAGLAVAFQFRHPSWHTDSVATLVESHMAAICHADGEPEPGPEGRGAFCYFRLRRPVYSPLELRRWSERLLGYAEAGRDVYAYFKHETLAPTYAAWVQTHGRIRGRAAL
jgi:uncharacterized protein YecE (DUF72 family)